MFVPFRDYKGNIVDALTKLIKDLRSFGYSGWRLLKVDLLKAGYGEQVCEVVTELINLELYRRDFKFMPPVFPLEEQEEDDASESW